MLTGSCSFSIYILHNPSFEWLLQTTSLHVEAIGTAFDGVTLRKTITLQAFNGRKLPLASQEQVLILSSLGSAWLPTYELRSTRRRAWWSWHPADRCGGDSEPRKSRSRSRRCIFLDFLHGQHRRSSHDRQPRPRTEVDDNSAAHGSHLAAIRRRHSDHRHPLLPVPGWR